MSSNVCVKVVEMGKGYLTLLEREMQSLDAIDHRVVNRKSEIILSSRFSRFFSFFFFVFSFFPSLSPPYVLPAYCTEKLQKIGGGGGTSLSLVHPQYHRITFDSHQGSEGKSYVV